VEERRSSALSGENKVEERRFSAALSRKNKKINRCHSELAQSAGEEPAFCCPVDGPLKPEHHPSKS
jgi:hypothetical protein